MPPTEYWLEFHGGRLTLFYTLPLKRPVAIHGKATLEVFDPEYFVAFSFPKQQGGDAHRRAGRLLRAVSAAAYAR